MTTTSAGVRRPWHLWLVGALSLAWNAMGAFDYLMTKTRNEAYLAACSPEQLAYVDSMPAWAVSAWALGVWGGVGGSLLLLFGRRAAVPVFAISLLGAVVGMARTYGSAAGREAMGGAGALAFAIVIVLVALGLWLYARAQAAAGRLR